MKASPSSADTPVSAGPPNQLTLPRRRVMALSEKKQARHLRPRLQASACTGADGARGNALPLFLHFLDGPFLGHALCAHSGVLRLWYYRTWDQVAVVVDGSVPNVFPHLKDVAVPAVITELIRRIPERSDEEHVSEPDDVVAAGVRMDTAA